MTVQIYSKAQHGNVQLSTHFKVKEFACNDGSDTIKIDSDLPVKLESIFNTLPKFGVTPKAMIIVSGYRTPSYDKKVGGSGSGPHCLTYDTEILTPQGWLLAEEISEGTEIFNYNIDTGKIVVDNVLEKVERISNKMIGGKSRNLDILVSEEHRMLYAPMSKNIYYRIAQANEIYGKRLHIKQAGNYENNSNEMSDDYIRLLVAIEADGYIRIRKGHNPSLHFHFKKQRKIDRIQMLLNSCKIPYNLAIRKDGTTELYISTYNTKQFYDFFGEEKLFPIDFPTSLSYQQREIFIDEIKFWDGSKDLRYKDGSTTLCTSRLHNAEIIQTMCVLTDKRCTLTTKGKLTHLTIVNTNQTQLSKNNWYKQNEETPIWCVVTNNGTLIARRNGRVFFTGNTYGYAADFYVTDSKGNKVPGIYIQCAAEYLGFNRIERILGGYNTHIDTKSDHWWAYQLYGSNGYTYPLVSSFLNSTWAKEKGIVKPTSAPTTVTVDPPSPAADPVITPDSTRFIQSYVGGKWLGKITAGSGNYSGILGKAITGIAAEGITVRVHTLSGKWLGSISKYDPNDWNKGVAGNKTAIDGICLTNCTYRVHAIGKGWLGWIYKSNYLSWKDGIAGIKGYAIDAIEIR